MLPKDSDALTDALSTMNRSQLLDIMWQVKDATLLDAKAVREVLIEKPSLTRALFEAQQALGLVKVPEEGGSEVTGPIMQQLLRMLKPLKADPKKEQAVQGAAHPLLVVELPVCACPVAQTSLVDRESHYGCVSLFWRFDPQGRNTDSLPYLLHQKGQAQWLILLLCWVWDRFLICCMACCETLW